MCSPCIQRVGALRKAETPDYFRTPKKFRVSRMERVGIVTTDDPERTPTPFPPSLVKRDGGKPARIIVTEPTT